MSHHKLEYERCDICRKKKSENVEFSISSVSVGEWPGPRKEYKDICHSCNNKLIKLIRTLSPSEEVI